MYKKFKETGEKQIAPESCLIMQIAALLILVLCQFTSIGLHTCRTERAAADATHIYTHDMC